MKHISEVKYINNGKVFVRSDLPPEEALKKAWEVYARVYGLPVEKSIVESSYGYMLGELWVLKDWS